MPTNEPPSKPGRGCLFYGGIAFGIISLVIVLMAYLGYRYAKDLVEQFTDKQPMTLPAVQLSESEISRLIAPLFPSTPAFDNLFAPSPLKVIINLLFALLFSFFFV